jgi:hypothetical protein
MQEYMAKKKKIKQACFVDIRNRRAMKKITPWQAR